MSKIHEDLFKATQVAGLSDKRAQSVTRKGTSLHPLSEKLIEDIWYLADCISSNRKVKRVMYKSGKRSAEYLEEQMCNLTIAVSTIPMLSPVSHPSLSQTAEPAITVHHLTELILIVNPSQHYHLAHIEL